MNREYPARMRDRGYPVLDCSIYEDMTQEEREQHKQDKKDYGIEGYEYKKKKNSEQEEQIRKNEKLIDEQAQTLEVQKEKINSGKEILSQQKEENKDLGIRIMSKKQVLELPEPPKTLDGQHYKVSIIEYRNSRPGRPNLSGYFVVSF